LDSACPEKDATEILSDSDYSTKDAPTTLNPTILLTKSIFYKAKDQGLVCGLGKVNDESFLQMHHLSGLFDGYLQCEKK